MSFLSPFSVYVALGSNMGNRRDNIASACRLLNAREEVSFINSSSLYETNALLKPGSPTEWNIPFLNSVIHIHTTLTPAELLSVAKDIERNLGRMPGEVWAPRTIDVDILMYNDFNYCDNIITLPHREMTNRDFVMVPLAEIAPELILPGKNISCKNYVNTHFSDADIILSFPPMGLKHAKS